MKLETKKRIRFISWILFVLYLFVLCYCLFLSEGYGRRGFQFREYRYNLVPFQEIKRFWFYREQVGIKAAFLNIGGNVIGFLPMGFFLPILRKRLRNGFLVTVMGFFFSLFVETVQLISKVGSFDVDDLILNTLGTFLGFLIFYICNQIRRQIYEEKI